MKKSLLILVVTFVLPLLSLAQCSTSNATGCQCLDTLQTNCDLLPDETISWYAVLNYLNGPNEFPQTGAGSGSQGPEDGRLRISGSTPNIGVGAFEVRAVDRNGYRWFLCGTDTFSIYDPNTNIQYSCANGIQNPRQLLVQRIYHKNGNVMTYTERFAGSMTYHPTHSHYHVDDWEIMTLRVQNPNDPNPLHWPIVGNGTKTGFCLMDYYQCGTNSGSSGYGHCRDSANNILLNSNFHNFDLGGGNYACSDVFQGISVGNTDVYSENLDGQWINIPPNTCNGLYYIVIQVDPNNYFLESNELNNVIAVPFTLTQQSPPGTPVVEITSEQSPVLCAGDSITLTTTGGSNFLWSNGDSTQSIKVPSSSNVYTVQVTNYCGVGVSNPFTVTEIPVPALPVPESDTICGAGSVTLTASGSGNLKWYDANGNWLGSGSVFYTPNISSTTTFYVENSETHPDSVFATPHDKNMNGGDYVTSTNYLNFNAESNFTLLSVKTYANTSGNRTIQLQDSMGLVLQTATVNIPAGESRVNLNFNIPVGIKYRLACTGAPDLFRNTGAGVNFPYGVPGTVKIYSATGGSVASFYFFYDWKVATTAGSCSSQRVAVDAVVEICAGVHENTWFKNSVNVYPNPAYDNFTVAFDVPATGTVEVSVLDLIGRPVFSKTLSNASSRNTVNVNTELFAKGIYIIKMDYDGISYHQKIAVE